MAGYIGSKAVILSTTGADISGNVVLSGTVDGRDVSVDGTKLDGIDTAAKDDQTAAEILTAVKTVDGAASGLDADLLDGQHGAYYTAYADTAITNLVDNSPAALNTLNELAAALGDDASFSTTVTNSIAAKLPLAGGTLTGDLTVSNASSPTIRITDTTNTSILDLRANDSDVLIRATSNHPMIFNTNQTNRMQIAANGDISFYEDTGSTAKLFWDASAERLGLTGSDYQFYLQQGSNQPWYHRATSNGQYSLHLNGTGDVITLDTSGNVKINSGSLDLTAANSYITGSGHNVLQVDNTRTYFYGGTDGVQFRTANNANSLVSMSNAGQVSMHGTGTEAYVGRLALNVDSTGSDGLYVRNASGAGGAGFDLVTLGSGYSAHGVSPNDIWLYSGQDINIGGATGGSNNVQILGNGAIRMAVSSAGIVTTPYQPNFLARMTTSSTSMTSSAWATFTFNATSWDRGSNFSTSNHRFIAPVAGIYFFQWLIQIESITTAPNWYYAYPLVNGSTTVGGTNGTTAADQMEPVGAYAAIKGTQSLQLAANDYVEMRYYWDSGNGLVKGSSESMFAGHLIG